MISTAELLELTAPIDDALRHRGYHRVPGEAGSGSDHVKVKWQHEALQQRIALTYFHRAPPVQGAPMYHSVVVSISDGRGRSISFMDLLRKKGSSAAKDFAVPSANVSQREFLTSFGSEFVARMMPEVEDIIEGKVWVDMPAPWDEYR